MFSLALSLLLELSIAGEPGVRLVIQAVSVSYDNDDGVVRKLDLSASCEACKRCLTFLPPDPPD
jgi:hypothetical protein